MIGAVVGVQPFGGHGVSGTGPKAGGPLYLRRLLASAPPAPELALAGDAQPMTHAAVARAYREFLLRRRLRTVAERVAHYLERSRVGRSLELPGPVGERNLSTCSRPRGRVAMLLGTDAVSAMLQLGAILATGNRALVDDRSPIAALLAELPADVAARIDRSPDWQTAAGPIDALLYAGERDGLLAAGSAVSRRDGAIVSVQGVSAAGLAAGTEDYALEQLLAEVTISTNTAAAGGNAKLMTIG